MKRITSFMLALVMLVSVLGSVSVVQAADQKAGENITWSIEGNVLTLSGTGEMYNYGPGNFPKWMANSTAEKIVISSGITSIGDYAFNALMRVTEVSIPTTVKTIGTRAFSGCHMLTSIHIPASVESIGDYALSTATDTMDNLVQITVDSDNKYFTVENGILYNSGKTVLYKMPSHLNMQIVNIPSSVVTIKPQAMLGCSSIKEIYLPASVRFVGQGAFENCSGLQKVTVNSSQCELGIGAVPDNEGLKLYGHKGTNVELYVQNNACKNIEFVQLGSEECQHIIKTDITPATRTAEGKIVETCTVCNKTISTT
ncbi:MAG: leucine-rich repeat domain-containing protein, partial [Eubacterium sp.]|nr:leucine-rich repeat domain-containing protein [Eubacterium sp.]MDE6154953.1 leucine-rich repeat domain-containing protein [Eubacterium sp.]